MQAVILAGGKGSRLKPFTTNIPKPLVPVDDTPILEVVLRQLRRGGFTDVTLAVNHLAELIRAFFGDGAKLGLKINYSLEDKPLGTAGPLRMAGGLEDNFLVMNGDLLTTLDYGSFYREHAASGADVSIAVYKKQVKIDLGVLDIRDGELNDYIEKPVYDFHVSTGIYMFSRKVVDLIPADTRLDMPDFILKLKRQGKKIRCVAPDFYWLDIGRVEDYEQAAEIFRARKAEFLP